MCTVLESGRRKVNQLHSVISNSDINVSACRMLLLLVVRPILEYGCEGNKTQAAALESVMLGGAKRILGSSSKTCNEAVRGDMGLETLHGRRYKAKLKWWYKVAVMSSDRYPSKLFSQEWDIKLRRGRQRKFWSKVVHDLLVSLELDKEEFLDEICRGELFLKGFLAIVGDSIDQRESQKFEEVKLSLYKMFGKVVQFKKYLHGPGDAGSRLLFKFRSGTHGELGRHRGREGRKECLLCGDECESVSHVLWECPAYNICRSDLTATLQDFLGEGFQDFQSLDSQGKSSFVLGGDLWKENFSSLLQFVKGYVLCIWELRKAKLYDNPNVQQSPSQGTSGVLPRGHHGAR